MIQIVADILCGNMKNENKHPDPAGLNSNAEFLKVICNLISNCKSYIIEYQRCELRERNDSIGEIACCSAQ